MKGGCIEHISIGGENCAVIERVEGGRFEHISIGGENCVVNERVEGGCFEHISIDESGAEEGTAWTQAIHTLVGKHT